MVDYGPLSVLSFEGDLEAVQTMEVIDSEPKMGRNREMFYCEVRFQRLSII